MTSYIMAANLVSGTSSHSNKQDMGSAPVLSALTDQCVRRGAGGGGWRTRAARRALKVEVVERLSKRV